jgi:hypothetical protein
LIGAAAKGEVLLVLPCIEWHSGESQAFCFPKRFLPPKARKRVILVRKPLLFILAASSHLVAHHVEMSLQDNWDSIWKNAAIRFQWQKPFDVVICWHVIYHTYKAIMVTTLQEIHMCSAHRQNVETQKLSRASRHRRIYRGRFAIAQNRKLSQRAEQVDVRSH